MTALATNEEIAEAIEIYFVNMLTNPALQRGARLVDFYKLLKRNRPAESDEQSMGEQGNLLMSLEDAIAKLTTALEANTKALSGAKPAAATKPAADKPAADKAVKGKHTHAEVTAILSEVKDKFDMEKAKELRAKYGKISKMADLVDPVAIDALYDACAAALAEADGSDDGGADGDGL